MTADRDEFPLDPYWGPPDPLDLETAEETEARREAEGEIAEHFLRKYGPTPRSDRPE